MRKTRVDAEGGPVGGPISYKAPRAYQIDVERTIYLPSHQMERKGQILNRLN